MFKLKADLMSELKNAGYSSYRLARDRVFGQRVIQKLREGGFPSWRELDVILSLTGLRIDDVVEHVPEDYATITNNKEDNMESISESTLRRKLKENGYALRKSRSGVTSVNIGGYMIVNEANNSVASGSNYDLTLDDVAEFVAQLQD